VLERRLAPLLRLGELAEAIVDDRYSSLFRGQSLYAASSFDSDHLAQVVDEHVPLRRADDKPRVGQRHREDLARDDESASFASTRVDGIARRVKRA